MLSALLFSAIIALNNKSILALINSQISPTRFNLYFSLILTAFIEGFPKDFYMKCAISILSE